MILIQKNTIFVAEIVPNNYFNVTNMSVIKCPNEVVVHLSDEDKGLCDLICLVGKMSPDEFLHVALEFYGHAVYKKLCSLSFNDVSFVKF